MCLLRSLNSSSFSPGEREQFLLNWKSGAWTMLQPLGLSTHNLQNILMTHRTRTCHNINNDNWIM